MTPLTADPAQLGPPVAALTDGVHSVIKRPCLPLISDPYEGEFSQPKAAALLLLDVHLTALERDVSVCDASAYRVQFTGARQLNTG